MAIGDHQQYKIAQHSNVQSVSTLPLNINSWERTFVLDTVRFQAVLHNKFDYIIIRLGENVDTSRSTFPNYYTELKKLVTDLKDYHPKAQMIMTGNVWESQIKDSIQTKVAAEFLLPYIDYSIFQQDSTNYAYGLFDHPGVAAHPSDKGMMEIAKSIYNIIEPSL